MASENDYGRIWMDKTDLYITILYDKYDLLLDYIKFFYIIFMRYNI